MSMIVLEKDLVVAIYNTLIERPFKEVAGVAVPLFQQMNIQIQALEASVESQTQEDKPVVDLATQQPQA